jgi:hypothetical protein
MKMMIAMKMAMKNAGINPEDVDYINAHGTSTHLNDMYETAAIKAAFGDAARSVAISSTKGGMGHSLGAAGGLETIVCLKAIETGIVPPTINYETPDPECDLNITQNVAVKKDIETHIATLSSKSGELPITVVNVLVGRAIPNDMQKEEMNRTAAATQAKRTEESRRDMLIAKEAAERQRAIADKAYQDELGLNTDQFIQLRAWEIIKDKQGANIDVMFNADNTNKMWNIRR